MEILGKITFGSVKWKASVRVEGISQGSRSGGRHFGIQVSAKEILSPCPAGMVPGLGLSAVLK